MVVATAVATAVYKPSDMRQVFKSRIRECAASYVHPYKFKRVVLRKPNICEIIVGSRHLVFVGVYVTCITTVVCTYVSTDRTVILFHINLLSQMIYQMQYIDMAREMPIGKFSCSIMDSQLDDIQPQYILSATADHTRAWPCNSLFRFAL